MLDYSQRRHQLRRQLAQHIPMKYHDSTNQGRPGRGELDVDFSPISRVALSGDESALSQFIGKTHRGMMFDLEPLTKFANQQTWLRRKRL